MRSVKPEFFEDRKLARAVSRDARLLYIGLWGLADEHARGNGDPEWLKGRLFPYDGDLDVDAVVRLLAELADSGRVVLYEANGDPLVFLPKLSKHQKLDSRLESRFPAPDDANVQVNGTTPVHADQSGRTGVVNESPPGPEGAKHVAGSKWQVASGRGYRGVANAAPPDRATRIPDDWQPEPSEVEWARAQGFPDGWCRYETETFVDYWRGKSGKDATKLDWPATWRNWLRKDAERSRASPGGTATAKANGWLTVGKESHLRAIEGGT